MACFLYPGQNSSKEVKSVDTVMPHVIKYLRPHTYGGHQRTKRILRGRVNKKIEKCNKESATSA